MVWHATCVCLHVHQGQIDVAESSAGAARIPARCQSGQRVVGAVVGRLSILCYQILSIVREDDIFWCVCVRVCVCENTKSNASTSISQCQACLNTRAPAKKLVQPKVIHRTPLCAKTDIAFRKQGSPLRLFGALGPP